jgi:hypothetical protein
VAVGEFTAFVIGWNLLIEHLIGKIGFAVRAFCRALRQARCKRHNRPRETVSFEHGFAFTATSGNEHLTESIETGIMGTVTSPNVVNEAPQF